MKNTASQLLLRSSVARRLSALLLLLVVGLAAAPGVARPSAKLAAVSSHAVEPARAASPAVDRPAAADLEDILRAAPGHPTPFAYIVDLDTNKVVLDVRGDKPAYPASVSKMFTTAAIMRTLKPGTRLVTKVLVKRTKRRTELAIVGSGDPSLTSKELVAFAKQVNAAGIDRIDKLWVDGSVFDDRLPRGFAEKLTDAPYRAPVGGLQIDSSAVVVAIKRGAKPGAAPTIEVRPRSLAVRVINQVTMVRGKGKPLSVTIAGDARQTVVTVTGKMGLRRRAVVTRKRVHDATYFAGEAFRSALIDAGVKVAGRTVYGSAPQGMKPFANHRSRPLVELVTTCAQTSHNGYAESFWKLLGGQLEGAPGSSEKGEIAAHKALGDLGIDFEKVRLGNGSGLYHANKVTAKQVVVLLKGMEQLGKEGERWRRTLAIAGVAGTLRGRLRGPATKGRVYAKTGTLDDVTALAGYALGPHHRYAFALFFNDVKAPARLYRRVHDRLLTALLEPSDRDAERPAPAPKPR